MAALSAVMYELMPADYEDMRRAFDELRYGNFSPTPLVGVGQLTQHDPSRAPEGKAIFHAWDYVPYQRKDGRSWDEAKREFAEDHRPHGRTTSTNVPDVVLDYHCDSPVDMERTSPASSAATCTASPPPPTSRARTARRRSSASTACRASSGSTSSARSSIRAAACSAPGARPPW
jgi:phytoene dehydrogenase-like protein